jgi:hypothetical protein
MFTVSDLTKGKGRTLTVIDGVCSDLAQSPSVSWLTFSSVCLYFYIGMNMNSLVLVDIYSVEKWVNRPKVNWATHVIFNLTCTIIVCTTKKKMLSIILCQVINYKIHSISEMLKMSKMEQDINKKDRASRKSALSNQKQNFLKQLSQAARN